jgi:transcriptional regulator with XRE-family HTH domain
MDDRWRNCEGSWDRLKWARMQRFDTARDAAESLGMKEGTYSAYERRPDSSKHIALNHQAAAKFAKKFKVSWIWLLTGEGTPETDQLTPAQERIIAATSGKPAEEQERIAAAIEALLRTGTGG